MVVLTKTQKTDVDRMHDFFQGLPTRHQEIVSDYRYALLGGAAPEGKDLRAVIKGHWGIEDSKQEGLRAFLSSYLYYLDWFTDDLRCGGGCDTYKRVGFTMGYLERCAIQASRMYALRPVPFDRHKLDEGLPFCIDIEGFPERFDHEFHVEQRRDAFPELGEITMSYRSTVIKRDLWNVADFRDTVWLVVQIFTDRFPQPKPDR